MPVVPETGVPHSALARAWTVVSACGAKSDANGWPTPFPFGDDASTVTLPLIVLAVSDAMVAADWVSLAFAPAIPSRDLPHHRSTSTSLRAVLRNSQCRGVGAVLELDLLPVEQSGIADECQRHEQRHQDQDERDRRRTALVIAVALGQPPHLIVPFPVSDCPPARP